MHTRLWRVIIVTLGLFTGAACGKSGGHPSGSDWTPPPCLKDSGLCICTANADCMNNEMGELCNTATSQCVACLTDEDCANIVAGPRCDTKAGQCGACGSDEDCASSSVGSACSTQDGMIPACGCNTDADCAHASSGAVCGGPNGPGCQCATAADCHDPTSPACFPPSGFATVNACGLCEQDSDCAGSPFGLQCNTSGACVQCLSNGDCGDAGTCNTTSGSCG